MAHVSAGWKFQRRGLVGGVCLAVAGGIVLVTPEASPDGSWQNLLLYTAGWPLFACGAALRWWATLYIGGRKERELVCEGPYSLCRHPLYLASLLIALSAGIMLGSMSFLAGVAMAALYYGLFAVPAEERYLRGLFGPAYEEYCRRVPRYLPRWSGYRSAKTLSVSTKALRLEGRRALRWLWIPVLVQIAAYLRGASWWWETLRALTG
ncbi:MAG: isoprenylcysteine carboxylmethyltransferase family protein [Pirellulales bacterium]|nr:isoprenylcysteine carboxylmethyltransferase family protein [Pirellulales bacterium]